MKRRWKDPLMMTQDVGNLQLWSRKTLLGAESELVCYWKNSCQRTVADFATTYGSNYKVF